MYQIASPEDMMLQLFSLPRRRVRTETSAEQSTREFLEMILTFNTISDDSTDDDDGDDDGDASNQDDLFS